MAADRRCVWITVKPSSTTERPQARSGWAIFFRGRHRQCGLCYWQTLQAHDKQLLTVGIGWAGLGDHVVSTRRWNQTHSTSHNGYCEWSVSWSCDLPFWRFDIARKVARFNHRDFFFWGYLKSRVYADNPWRSQPKGEYSIGMRTCHGKCDKMDTNVY